jgi:hypothetical protein
MERILDRLSEVVPTAICGTIAQQGFVPYMLRDLVRLENRPVRLTEIAYEWCSVICQNHENFWNWKVLLLFCLEIGFRHLDFQCGSTEAYIRSSEHHRGLIDVVFKSQESEVIADLLHAWTMAGRYDPRTSALLGSCAGHLVGLQNLVPFSSRLRRLVIHSVETIGYAGFEGVGVERFIGLLNHLHVAVEDMDEKDNWAILLSDTIQSSEGAQHLSHWYWESLVELVVSESQWLPLDPARSLQIVTSLTEAKEWSKLECWVGIVWMVWGREAGGMIAEDLDRSTLLLFRQQPGATHKLERRMERWSQQCSRDVPESFKQICKQAHEATQQASP